MKSCVIYNPNAGSSDSLADALQTSGFVSALLESRRAGDARRLAARAADEGHDLIVAAGGDGTIHEVVNGIMRSRRAVTMGIIPLGTGNDLVRTLGIPDDPAAAIATLKRGRVATIDLMRVRIGRRTLFGCNVAAGGFTGQMNEAITDEIKQRWGPLAYLRGAVNVVPDLTRYCVSVRYDGSPAQQVPAMNVIVANARFAGGGIAVAPGANPEDGLLDVVIVRSGSVLELTGVAARLVAGDYTSSDLVTHRRAKRVEIDSQPPMAFNVDGELLSNERIVFSAAPAELRVIVGTDYSPAAG